MLDPLGFHLALFSALVVRAPLLPTLFVSFAIVSCPRFALSLFFDVVLLAFLGFSLSLSLFVFCTDAPSFFSPPVRSPLPRLNACR